MAGSPFIPIARVPVWKMDLEAKAWEEGGASGDASSMDEGDEEGFD